MCSLVGWRRSWARALHGEAGEIRNEEGFVGTWKKILGPPGRGKGIEASGGLCSWRGPPICRWDLWRFAQGGCGEVQLGLQLLGGLPMEYGKVGGMRFGMPFQL